MIITDQKNLILGTIPDDFDPERHVVLAPFCFVGREHVYPNWDQLPFEPDPFATPEEFKAADDLTCSYALGLNRRLGEDLNRKYGLTHGFKFWKTMLFPWLALVVQTAYERQLRVERLINKYSDCEMIVTLVCDDINWNFKDVSDFWDRGLWDAVFNEWLISRIIEGTLPENYTVQWVSKKNQIKSPTSFQVQKSWPRRKLGGIYNYFMAPKFSRYSHVYGVNFLEASCFNMILKSKSNRTTEQNTKVDEKNSNTDIPWIFDFMKLLDDIMPDSVKKIPNLIESKKIKTSSGKWNLGSQQLWYDEERKVEIGLKLDGGERVIGSQHGGHCYGTSKFVNYDNEVEYSQDAFITWGWDEMEDYKNNYVPLPSPLMSRMRNRHQQKNQKIVLIGQPMTPFVGRYNGLPQAKQWVNYRNDKANFVKSLSDKNRREFWYRPFMRTEGVFRDGDYLQERFSDIHLIKDNLHNEMFNCKLVVMDNDSTSLNIALAANIPTICFWNPDAFAHSRQSQVYMERFKELKMYFENGTEAAFWINELGDNVQEWWNGADIQNVKNEWVHKYARTSKTWRREWISTLLKI